VKTLSIEHGNFILKVGIRMDVTIKRIVQLLEESNMTLTELAKRMRIPEVTIANWKKGSMPRHQTLVRISELFDVDIAWLQGLTDEREIPKRNSESEQILDKIFDLMRSYKITSNKLAKELKISYDVINYWNKYCKVPDYSNLVKIADFFNVNIEWLLGRSDIEKKIIRIHDMIASNEEISLIKQFRKLNHTGQEKLQDMIEFLLSKYKRGG